MKLVKFLIVIMLISSCAPLFNIKNLTCEQKFDRIVQQDRQIKDNFSFKAVIYYENKKLYVKGNAKGKDYLKLKVYLPLGISLGTIEKTPEKTCLEIKGIKQCFEEINLLKELFDIDIPLQSIISKKFYLTGKEKFSCKDNKIFVDTPNFTIVYKIQMNKFVPEKIVFTDYEINYKQENGEDFIVINVEGVEIKIQVKGIYL